MDLQPLSQKNNNPSPLQIIMMIIFVLPAIIHGFKWGWIYPVATGLFLVLALMMGDFIPIILGLLLFIGSIFLCRRRMRIMRAQRENATELKPCTPIGMRDYD